MATEKKANRGESIAMLLVLGILLLAGTMAQDELCERQLVLDWGQVFNVGFHADFEKVWNSCKWFVSSPSGTNMTLSCHYTDLPKVIFYCPISKISSFFLLGSSLRE